MQKYKDFQPTGFDSRGLSLPNRQEWFVLGVSQTRDSDLQTTCNFTVALSMLGGESRCIEVHRFNHWGPGWFEIILISPTAKKKLLIAEDIDDMLENYALLDDEKYSALVHTKELENLEREKNQLTGDLAYTLGITDLELPEAFWSYAVTNNLVDFGEYQEPRWSKWYKHEPITIPLLIKHKATFTFPLEDDDENYAFDFTSKEHPDCLNASLARALAQADTEGRPYTYNDGTALSLPSWVYPNPNQITLNLD